MSKFYLYNLLAVLSLFFSTTFAQGIHHGGHYNPDSLEIVTKDGWAIVDTTIGMHSMYYLDENNDGNPDYFLNFGPWWYEPDSSNAVRPDDGEMITITGGVVDSTMMNNYPMIIVYEINGDFWRDPYDPFWNEMGNHHGGNHMMDSCFTSGFGWMHDSLQTVSLSGYAIVDTTFIMEHFYLDEDNDGIPDYFLNFGPPWYDPGSGATRPENGDQINIVGGMLDNGNFPMIVVYEINGLFWRDSTSFGHHFGSGWIHRNMTDPELFHTPFDSLDMITMQPGWWSGGGGHHGGMHDSLFCQMLEILPGDIIPIGNENAFAGYEMDFFFPSMMGGGMNNSMGCGGHMNFNSNADFQLHYTDAQLADANISESTIMVKYWDSDLSQWTEISGANVNTTDNLVTFNNAEVGNFIILTGDSPTSVKDTENIIPDQFVLKQNYPNPFNPATTIEFSIPEKSHVALTVYNILGKEIAKLADGNYNAGNYSIVFDARSLPSGVYFYQLKAGNFYEVKKMQLIK